MTKLVTFSPPPSGYGAPSIRSMDAAHFNRIANDPAVRLHLGGAGVLDFTQALADVRNVAFRSEHGGFILEQLAAGLYEVHSMFLPAGRGEEPRALMAEAMRFMFCGTPCLELVTRVPDDNVAAGKLAREAGFHEMFHAERNWRTPAGDMIGCSHQLLTVVDWLNLRPDLRQVGGALIQAIEIERAAKGLPAGGWFASDIGLCALGAMLMASKGSALGKWLAILQRYGRILDVSAPQVLQESPLLIGLNGAIVQIIDGAAEVLDVS